MLRPKQLRSIFYKYHSLCVCPTFADVLVLEPQLSLDLFVGVPDGAGLLEAVHRLLNIMVPKLPEDGDKVAPLRCPVQRMDGRAESWVEEKKGIQMRNKKYNRMQRYMHFVYSAVSGTQMPLFKM